MEEKKREKPGKILIAIGPSPNSSYLVRWARRTASAFGWGWAAVHVDTGRKPSRGDAERLEANLVLCRETGAEALILESPDIASGVVRAAREIDATLIVIGRSGLSRNGLLPHRHTVSDRIILEADPIDVAVIRDSGASVGRSSRGRIRALLGATVREYVILALSFAAATGIGFLLSPIIGYRSIAFLYLAAVLGLSFLVRPVPVSIFAVLSAVILNFFFMEPRYTLRIAMTEDVFLFMAYFLVAVTGSLVARLGRNERMLLERERRNAFLLESTLRLAQCRTVREAAEAAVSLIKRFCEAQSLLLVSDADGLSVAAPAEGAAAIGPETMEAARYALSEKKPGGYGSERAKASHFRCLPAIVGDRPVGVVAVVPPAGRPWRMGDDNLILSLGRTFAFIVERERSEDERRKAALAVESERISKVLLDSVSHELRTPLTTITGSISALKDDGVAESKASRDVLVDGALEAADRLNRIVEDILSLSRIESGSISLSLSPVDLGDIAYEALAAARDGIGPERVRVTVSGGAGPAVIDLGLITSMVANLLRNAGRYSAPESPVELDLAEDGGRLSISVRDHGPGVPEADLDAIFERFKRGRNASGGGVGLGLAICKGIALAHGGSIAARNAPGGGLLVRAVIPGRPGGRAA